MSRPAFQLAATKQHGRLVFEDEQAYRERVQRLREGHTFIVTITEAKKEKRRTLEQNAWLWGAAYETIVAAWGYDLHDRKAAKEHLHYELLKKCFGTRWDPFLKGEIPNVLGSSTLSTVQFSEYMDWLMRYAADDLGIFIPDPNPAWRVTKAA